MLIEKVFNRTKISKENRGNKGREASEAAIEIEVLVNAIKLLIQLVFSII